MEVTYRIIPDRNLLMGSYNHMQRVCDNPEQLVQILCSIIVDTHQKDKSIIMIRFGKTNQSGWMSVEEYRSIIPIVKKPVKPFKYKVQNEHFGRADQLIEIATLEKASVCTIIKDGEATIFPSIYDATKYVFTKNNAIERFYCNEEQLEFIYSYFADYYDISSNFDVETSKRKEHENTK
jgi:hypothetical protein